jgi:hypothetical protein
MDVGFEAAVIIAITKVYWLWRQLQNIDLTVQYKENEQVRLTCRIFNISAYLPISKVEEGWFMIMQNVPHFCCPTQPR